MAGEAEQGFLKPRAVFDCMVFLQGAGRPASPARACLRLVDEERITLCLSVDILAEVRDVLTRPKTTKRFPLLTRDWVDAFLQNAESKAVRLPHVPKFFSFERDPKDEPYLNLALATHANYLVSRDRDLLDLMNNADFRKRFPELTILDPVGFLKEMARQDEPTPGLQQNEAHGDSDSQDAKPGES